MCTITKTLAKQASEQHRKCEKGPFVESLSDDQPYMSPNIQSYKWVLKYMCLMC